MRGQSRRGDRGPPAIFVERVGASEPSSLSGRGLGPSWSSERQRGENQRERKREREKRKKSKREGGKRGREGRIIGRKREVTRETRATVNRS